MRARAPAIVEPASLDRALLRSLARRFDRATEARLEVLLRALSSP